MKRRSSKHALWMLAVCIMGVLGLGSVQVHAEEEDEILEEGNYTYIVLKDETAEIVNYVDPDNVETVVTVPATLGGKRVTSLYRIS